MEFCFKNSYWGKNGKYQEDVNKLNELMPDYGYTTNKYMNLFITISKIYYRKYNDGDSIFEFEERVTKYIEPFAEQINFNSYKDYDGQELEDLVDRVILFIKDKDLSYESIDH